MRVDDSLIYYNCLQVCLIVSVLLYTSSSCPWQPPPDSLFDIRQLKLFSASSGAREHGTWLQYFTGQIRLQSCEIGGLYSGVHVWEKLSAAT